MSALKRRLKRLEAILLARATPAPTEEDIRFGDLCESLLKRLHPAVAEQIAADRWRYAENVHANIMSNLYFGFLCTVNEHRRRSTPLEFPEAVAQAYASNAHVTLVECTCCQYRFPWGIGNEPFKCCPLCGGVVTSSLPWQS